MKCRAFSNLEKIYNNLDLSNFNTKNVEYMVSMFQGSHKLTSLDISKFESDKIKDISSMFEGLSVIKEIIFSSKFITNNVVNISRMFYSCVGLQKLDISNFDTSEVETFANMFRGCKNLQSLDVSNFETKNSKNMAYMFAECASINLLM